MVVFYLQNQAEEGMKRLCLLACCLLTLPNQAIVLCFVLVCSFFKLVEKRPDSSARLYAEVNERRRKQWDANGAGRVHERKYPYADLYMSRGSLIN